ncbi:MAG: hypothetical protein QF819_09780 [Gemmatimonadota bacterium]|jgi:hypothetical protein|nr:hypothetical protein [Gemmatimonadota bacterium]MDP7030922.1 hypothetical protein [Gemmatimonadota bacterium]
MTHRLRNLAVLSGLCALLLFLPGCPLSPDSDDGGGGGGDTRIPERDSISNVVVYLQEVWNQRLYTHYEQLLHDSFEFFPLSGDPDLEWVEGDSWGRSMELGMVNHMFDPNYSGDEPPVEDISLDLDILSQREVNDYPGAVEVTCNVNMEILKDASNGWRVNQKTRLLILPDPDEAGLLQVIKQWDLDDADG